MDPFFLAAADRVSEMEALAPGSSLEEEARLLRRRARLTKKPPLPETGNRRHIVYSVVGFVMIAFFAFMGNLLFPEFMPWNGR